MSTPVNLTSAGSRLDLSCEIKRWDRLMRHLRELIGRVTDQEGVSRRMIAHCGLGWEERCLSFHRISAAVTTASAVQVYADRCMRIQSADGEPRLASWNPWRGI